MSVCSSLMSSVMRWCRRCGTASKACALRVPNIATPHRPWVFTCPSCSSRWQLWLPSFCTNGSSFDVLVVHSGCSASLLLLCCVERCGVAVCICAHSSFSCLCARAKIRTSHSSPTGRGLRVVCSFWRLAPWHGGWLLGSHSPGRSATATATTTYSHACWLDNTHLQVLAGPRPSRSC